MFFDCDEIIQGRVWVGGQVRPEDVGYLRRLGITAVISLQSDRDLEYYGIAEEDLLAAYKEARISFRRIPITDFDKKSLWANLPRGVQGLEKALSSEEERVYIHCTAGVNRSPTVVAAYLIRCRQYSARQAYDFLTSMRNCNPYFDTLEAYEVAVLEDRAGRT